MCPVEDISNLRIGALFVHHSIFISEINKQKNWVSSQRLFKRCLSHPYTESGSGTSQPDNYYSSCGASIGTRYNSSDERDKPFSIQHTQPTCCPRNFRLEFVFQLVLIYYRKFNRIAFMRSITPHASATIKLHKLSFASSS